MRFRLNTGTELQPRFTELNDEVARLYATNFSEQELKEILTFTRRRLEKLAQRPKVVDASMKFAQDWANKLSEIKLSERCATN